MKNTYILLFICTFAFSQIQQTNDVHQEIANVEQKGFHSLHSFKQNQNTTNYDIIYNRLELELDPNAYYIKGTVTAHFIPNEPISNIHFDLNDNMTINTISYNNENLTFSQTNDELIINFNQNLAAQVKDSLHINYEGTPSSQEDAFTTNSHDGVPALWTLSEPFGAKDWWPCKQSLNDKIEKTDIFVTHPSIYKFASNGKLLSETDLGNNQTLTKWQHNYPIPAYLVSLALTNYETFILMAGETDDQFPIVNYVYPESLDYAQTNTSITVDVMNFFEDTFGEYPYRNEKYGHAQFGWGGGMEHATMSSMGSFSRKLIVHELAHQWFGNKVTCSSWGDIWLNEGFASYLGGMTIEHLDGEQAFLNWKQSEINHITSQSGGSTYVYNDTSVGAIFSSRLTYSKGGYIVHMLRWLLGDEAFKLGLQNYLNDPDLAYGYANTNQLKTHLENVSGLDLTNFFNDWLYNQGYPSYQLEWSQDANQQLKVRVNQTQSHASVDFFEMKIPIQVLGTNGEILDLTFEHTQNNQLFTAPINFEVSGIEFNKKLDILSKNNTITLNNSLEVVTNTNTNISINPNPVKFGFNINSNSPIQMTTIYNSIGQKVYHNAEHKNYHNIKHLQKGVYIVRVQTATKVKNLKIIKE